MYVIRKKAEFAILKMQEILPRSHLNFWSKFTLEIWVMHSFDYNYSKYDQNPKLR